jgi:thiol-disulfide isomerase/thioredoxin
MGKVLKRVAVAMAALVLVAACVGLLLFRMAERHVAARMQPPHLEREPETASDMVFRTLDGRVEYLAETKGHVVFLNLWGTWCIQCVAEMPTVQALYDRYKGDPQVEFLVVSRLDPPSRVRLYARHGRYDLPFYVTQDEDIPESMQLGQYPATFLYAKDGSLVAKQLGAADWSDGSVVKFIDQLKAER